MRTMVKVRKTLLWKRESGRERERAVIAFAFHVAKVCFFME